mgnify:CR=1 FL=1
MSASALVAAAKIDIDYKTELRHKMEHELALDKLKALVMKKWRLGDPLPVLYMDVDDPYTMAEHRKAKTASLVVRREGNGYRVA